MNTRQRSGALCLGIILTAAPAGAASLTSAPFGTVDGKPIERYTMAASSGVSVTFMNYGGAITDITAPDRHGYRASSVLGLPTFRDYQTRGADGELYFGALIGRYANRIAKGHLVLDGRTLEWVTTEPGMQIYTTSFFDGRYVGTGGR